MDKSSKQKKHVKGVSIRVRKDIVGICADAKTLGVTRSHLYKVLTGQRESKPLLEHYNSLKQATAQTPCAEIRRPVRLPLRKT